jgi:hypothetical protein
LTGRQARANVGAVSFLLALAAAAAVALWLAQRPTAAPRLPPPLTLLVTAGAPLALLGLVLGPGVDVITAPVERALAPLAVLAVGWIGAALGAELDRRRLRRVVRRPNAVPLAGAAGACVAVSVAAWALARSLPALRDAWHPIGASVLALGAIAMMSGTGAVALAARHTRLDPRRTLVAVRIARLETALGALAVALALAVRHPGGTIPGGAAGWLAAAAGTGALAGLLCLWLVRLAPQARRGPLVPAAALLMAAGGGHAAGLSPFVVCVACGATIALVSRADGRWLRRVLDAGLRPAAVALLVLAGARLRLPTPALLVAIPLLVAARSGAKWGVARSWRQALALTAVPPDRGLATTAQGLVAVAAGMSVALTFDGAAGLLTTVVLATALTLVTAPRLLTAATAAREG